MAQLGDKRRIALFGGNFDPPHVGHVLTISNILNSGLVDEVWIVPTGDDRYDKTPIANAIHRRTMVDLLRSGLFAIDAPVRVECIQVEGRVPGSSTMALVDALSAEYPQHEFLNVIGADNIGAISSWREADRLQNEAKFLAVPRPGTAVQTPLPANVTLIPADRVISTDVSSSAIRKLMQEKKNVAGMLPVNVLHYIAQKKLYT